MDRRTFFRRAAGKAGETVVREIDDRVAGEAAHWIRPPYALAELDFLLACSRCSDCIDACPHQVIFALPSRLGARVVNTPALDLLNKGCHLCEDWPCVQVCETGALKLPDNTEETDTPLPVLARAVIDTQHCLPYAGPECGACQGSCPVPGAMTWHMEKPAIVAELCTGCGMCREACIVEPKAVLIRSLYRQDTD